MKEEREALIRRWFRMWTEQRDTGIAELFDPSAVYIESWGPEYRGADKIAHWFREWNRRGRVLVWEIQGMLHGADRTMAQWYFKDRMADGRVEEFDGVTLIQWTPEGKIGRLQEFGCNRRRYDPYEHGPEPRFRKEPAAWF